MKQNYANKKISIITVCYNSEKTILDTLESVASQTYKNYEHIIIDGKSNDNTLKIIDDFKSKHNNNIICISEKDKGIYDAMNKGIKKAKGDIIGILNSDDKYYDKNTLKKINESISIGIDGIYGDLLYVDEETMKKPIRKWITGKGTINSGWMPAHPTLYLTKEVYDKIGNYNLNYKIVADYDFMIRLCKSNFNLKYIKDYLVLMRHGGVSSNGFDGYKKNIKEAYNALKSNKVGFPFAGGIIVIRIIRTLFQLINAKFMKKDLIIKD